MNGTNALKAMENENYQVDKFHWTDGLIIVLLISAIIGVIYGFCKLI